MLITVGISVPVPEGQESISVRTDLLKTLIAHGAFPVILPAVGNANRAIEFLSSLDGLIITDDDIIMKEKTKDNLEADLVNAAVRLSMPVLGAGDGLHCIGDMLSGNGAENSQMFLKEEYEQLLQSPVLEAFLDAAARFRELK